MAGGQSRSGGREGESEEVTCRLEGEREGTLNSWGGGRTSPGSQQELENVS
jgi:hypothetical protein